LGCGNSRLSEELRKEGVADITCIDLASTAVERMKKHLSAKGISGIVSLLMAFKMLIFGTVTVTSAVNIVTRRSGGDLSLPLQTIRV
jgi:predicted O-methyltransferase YrrM